MRLSEAIRLGAMIRGQAFGFFFQDGQSCAFGAALEAVGTPYGAWELAADVIRDRWPWTWARVAACPDCGESEPVRVLIAHLNNDHRWTRARIAEWVETIEKHRPSSSFLAYLRDVEGVNARSATPDSPHGGDREEGISVGV